jgi:hypothetical protein
MVAGVQTGSDPRSRVCVCGVGGRDGCIIQFEFAPAWIIKNGSRRSVMVVLVAVETVCGNSSVRGMDSDFG